MSGYELHHEPSAIGSGLTVIVPALHSCGVAAEALFERHGVQIPSLSDPGYRLPVSCTASLWADAANSAGDETFGLRAGSCALPTMYHSLGMALWSGSTSRQLFDSWIKHLPLISTAAIANFSDRGDHYGNFARAFKRWVGKTPHEYRADTEQPPAYCYS